MLKYIIPILLFSITFSGCIFPYEDTSPENAWRGYCFRNNSSYPIIILHIAANVYISPRDSTFFQLGVLKDSCFIVRTSDNITNVMKYLWDRDFDTVKVFRADTVAKIWHGPVTNNQSESHTPYETGDWERIEKNDTIILRFTITDKDFE